MISPRRKRKQPAATDPPAEQDDLDMLPAKKQAATAAVKALAQSYARLGWTAAKKTVIESLNILNRLP